ncbi:B3 domain-containing protein Os06g0194400-like isoform X2 [Cornus florida]|uniref:B3 domain-containing protein Os06g0194400-like isoform X2 n=1 Tax=Cornus florida TaxID=4283 RepID=UPI0028A2991E|nr:B3 domain-containing protein Os06g0194400-like isoform X2 [Cornus florida]
MEAKKVKEEVMRQHHETQTCIEEEEYMAYSHSSVSVPNLVDSSPKIKRKPPLRIKRKKRSTLKSKNAKQVISKKLGKSGSCKKKRTKIDDLYDNVEAKFSVMDRAEEVLTNLAADFPCFAKCMLPSNVAYSFWLILPAKFCYVHLPRHDTTVTLVDECGEEFETNYLVNRHGLSGGWRAFSMAHRLLKGDHVVFQLVGSCKLKSVLKIIGRGEKERKKVNIVRVYGLDEVDAALCLMNLVAHAKGKDAVKHIKTRKKAWKSKEPLLLDIHNENVQKNYSNVSTSNIGLAADQSENNSDGFGSEVFEGCSEISNRFRLSELCWRQNSYPQGHILEGVNCRQCDSSNFLGLSTVVSGEFKRRL